jgi:hypothetical protein
MEGRSILRRVKRCFYARLHTLGWRFGDCMALHSCSLHWASYIGYCGGKFHIVHSFLKKGLLAQLLMRDFQRCVGIENVKWFLCGDFMGSSMVHPEWMERGCIWLYMMRSKESVFPWTFVSHSQTYGTQVPIKTHQLLSQICIFLWALYFCVLGLGGPQSRL